MTTGMTLKAHHITQRILEHKNWERQTTPTFANIIHDITSITKKFYGTDSRPRDWTLNLALIFFIVTYGGRYYLQGRKIFSNFLLYYYN